MESMRSTGMGSSRRTPPAGCRRWSAATRTTGQDEESTRTPRLGLPPGVRTRLPAPADPQLTSVGVRVEGERPLGQVAALDRDGGVDDHLLAAQHRIAQRVALDSRLAR